MQICESKKALWVGGVKSRKLKILNSFINNELVIWIIKNNYLSSAIKKKLSCTSLTLSNVHKRDGLVFNYGIAHYLSRNTFVQVLELGLCFFAELNFILYTFSLENFSSFAFLHSLEGITHLCTCCKGAWSINISVASYSSMHVLIWTREIVLPYFSPLHVQHINMVDLFLLHSFHGLDVCQELNLKKI